MVSRNQKRVKTATGYNKPTSRPLPSPENFPVNTALKLPDWITDELIIQTLETWQPYYEHLLTRDGAIEIILSIGHFWDAVGEPQ